MINNTLTENTLLTTHRQVPYIFLAEDDVDDQELLIEAFQVHTSDFPFQTATNGKKAALFLDELPDAALPSLIILDYNLPEVDGAQLLELLAGKTRFNAIPKIVWSTSNSPLYKQICLQMGAKAYFVKPVDIKGIEVLAKQMLSFLEHKS